MFGPLRPLKPSQMFAGKARVCTIKTLRIHNVWMLWYASVLVQISVSD
jgi:hypothetical protein